MRILFLNPVGAIGGAERVLLTAIAGIRQSLPGAVIRVITFSDGPLLAAVRALGAEAEIVPLPKLLSATGDSQSRGKGWRKSLLLLATALPAIPQFGFFALKFRAAVATFKPDLVHSNGIKSNLLAGIAVPRRVRLVWHVHDFYGLRSLAGFLLRRVRSRVRAGVAISEAVAHDARRALPGLRITTIPNAIDVQHFAPQPDSRADLDRAAGLAPAPVGTVRVGLVATYARWKGQLAFLEAAALLTREAPDLPIRWYIIGGPIYHTAAQFTPDELKAAVAERGITDRVGFVPFASDPAPIYRALDVVVHASTLPEPFGLTVAEAMACGRAVIVSRAGGAAELFTEGHDALGAMPGNVREIASAVRRLVQDCSLRERLATAARNTAQTQFDRARYGPALVKLYSQLQSRSR